MIRTAFNAIAERFELLFGLFLCALMALCVVVLALDCWSHL